MDKEFWLFSSQTIIVLILALYSEIRIIGERWSRLGRVIRSGFTALFVFSSASAACALFGALSYFSGSGDSGFYVWCAKVSISSLITIILIYPLLDIALRAVAYFSAWLIFIDPRGRIRGWNAHRRATQNMKILDREMGDVRRRYMEKQSVLLHLNYLLLRAVFSANIRVDNKFDAWLSAYIQSAPRSLAEGRPSGLSDIEILRWMRCRALHVFDEIRKRDSDLRERVRESIDRVEATRVAMDLNRSELRKGMVDLISRIEAAPIQIFPHAKNGDN